MSAREILALHARIEALERMQGAGEGQVISSLIERMNALEQKVEEVLDTAAPMGSVRVLRDECERLSRELKALNLRTQLRGKGKKVAN